MLIIAFGDIHNHTEAAQKIPGIERADAVLLTGDLTISGGRRDAARVLEAVSRLNPRVYAQIGNMDLDDVDAMLTEMGINLNGRGILLGEVGIFGLGGSTPTPFCTPSEFSEDDLERRVWQGYEAVKGARFKILLSHTPPIDTRLDRTRGGRHAGSRAVRDFLARTDCSACVCGHIHEAVGTENVGSAVVINPGPVGRGGYALIRCGRQGLSATLEMCPPE